MQNMYFETLFCVGLLPFLNYAQGTAAGEQVNAKGRFLFLKRKVYNEAIEYSNAHPLMVIRFRCAGYPCGQAGRLRNADDVLWTMTLYRKPKGAGTSN